MSHHAPLLTNEELLQVYSLTHTATAIHVGEQAVIQTANDAMLRIWGKDKSIIGKTLEEGLPELKGQPFIEMFKQVWTGGLVLSGSDTAAQLTVDGKLQTYYFDFEYRAVRNSLGEVMCILHTAIDVTERVLKQQALAIAQEKEKALEREQILNEELAAANEELNTINEELQQTQESLAELNAELEGKVEERVKDLQESNDDYQALNEEFSALNEELAATVEELSASNEELMASRVILESRNKALARSEARFRSLIRQAPVGICVVRAGDLMIQEVNDSYLALVGKHRGQMEDRTIWEAVPEVAEDYAPVMHEVISSGIAFVANEHELPLFRNGKQEAVYVDFVYEPVSNHEGKVMAVMVIGIDVTDKVMARRNIEDVEERIRLAVQAAEIGTFEHNYNSDQMVTSERFNAIFGSSAPMSRSQFLTAIHPDDLHLSAEAHAMGRATGKMDYEARLYHPDGSLHWIRVQGAVYYDSPGQPVRLLGTVLDITEFKRLQQQKDDFISIASHELKTPLTSLKASLQLLERMKDNPSAAVVPKLIEQSSRSMGKISELVEDLLNVSRMNHGQIMLNKKMFRVSGMLNDCCSHIRAAGKHELIFRGDQALQVFADEHRIDQVVVNLVNNAVKYAPGSDVIYLEVERLADVARISVVDSGPGIPAEKIPHLFDRYYRADVSGLQVSGLGLGLYISAEIVARHGGEIGVQSEEGKGSTFWFTLPLSTMPE